MRFTILIILLAYIILKIAELAFPLRKMRRSWQSRLWVNLTITVIMFIAAILTIGPASRWLIQISTHYHIGLLHWLSLPFWATFILGVLLMDVTFYYWHWMNHNLPLLWRFHNMHHIDPDLDVTTAFRFHFVEIMYSTLFRAVQLLIIGINPVVFITYGLLFQLNTLFQHSNLRLPIGFERWLNKIIVTPRMHGIHHSQVRQETNSNYSVVFSIWDRLHRTLRLNIAQADITIGIAAYSQSEDNRVLAILTLPFRRQRRYWDMITRNNFDQSVVKKPRDFLCD